MHETTPIDPLFGICARLRVFAGVLRVFALVFAAKSGTNKVRFSLEACLN